MMNLKELREKRAELVRAMRALHDSVKAENRAWSEADQKSFTELETRIGEFDAEIERVSRLESLEESVRQPAPTPEAGREDYNGEQERQRQRPNHADNGVADEHRMLALQAWFARNAVEPISLTTEQEDACKRLRFQPDRKAIDIRLHRSDNISRIKRAWNVGGTYHERESRAQSAIIGTLGGLTVPDSFVNQLEVNMLAFGSVRQAARILRTADGRPMPMPTVDDTGNKGAQVGENAAATEQNTTFGGMVLNAYKMHSKYILVPFELLRDSAFSFADMLAQLIAERLGRIIEEKLTTGTGAGTPRGVVTASALGKTTASSTAIAWAEITDLIHSIDPAYRPGSAFMFHDNIYLHLRKLTDGFGRPLWADGPNSTPPATLQGYPYFINQEMASSVATTNKTMLFGNFNQYIVREVNSIRLYRLEELKRLNDQDAFIAFQEIDGNLMNAGTAPIKHMLQV